MRTIPWVRWILLALLGVGLLVIGYSIGRTHAYLDAAGNLMVTEIQELAGIGMFILFAGLPLGASIGYSIGVHRR